LPLLREFVLNIFIFYILVSDVSDDLNFVVKMDENKDEAEQKQGAPAEDAAGPSSSSGDAVEGSSRSPSRKQAQNEGADAPESKTRKLDGESESGTPPVFKKSTSSTKRNYRKTSKDSDDEYTSAEGEPAENMAEENKPPTRSELHAMADNSSDSEESLNVRLQEDRLSSSSSSSSTSGPDSPVGLDRRRFSESEVGGDDHEDEPPPAVLTKKKPKHKWNMALDISSRYFSFLSSKSSNIKNYDYLFFIFNLFNLIVVKST